MISAEQKGNIGKVVVGGIEATRKCADIMREGVRLTFLNRGYQSQWPNLANGRPATLFRTGTLQASVANESNQFLTDTSAEIRVGPEAFYGSYLHFGTSKMPARPFMLWREDMIEAVTEIMGKSVRFENPQHRESNITRGAE